MILPLLPRVQSHFWLLLTRFHLFCFSGEFHKDSFLFQEGIHAFVESPIETPGQTSIMWDLVHGLIIGEA